jgi:3-methyladenine DNA glycosylase AlkD
MARWQYGVRMGDIRTIAKAIKANPALGLQLWATGNVDARFLATLILKPKVLSLSEVTALVRSNDLTPILDWVNFYVLKAHPDKETLRDPWMDETHPMLRRAGWSLIAERVDKSPEGPDLRGLLARLEAEMPGAPDLVHWTMNNTLAAIGITQAPLRARLLEMGERMGIYRDYPTLKGRTSPFVPLWIGETVRRAG